MNITTTDKALIVNMHNKLRRQVAKGLEKRGSPGPQLAAANMREIVILCFLLFFFFFTYVPINY